MALVDYDSGSETESAASAPERDHQGEAFPAVAASVPAAKKRKLSSSSSAVSDLPPLPSNFHDLYASTVRLSNTDDPSLHQGRRRQVPHIAGNWPSHLYIEWRPSGVEHETLGDLLRTLSSRLVDAATRSPSSSSSSNPANAAEKVGLGVGSKQTIEVRDFLTSDLGAPLPLHISLSRPLSLTTARKDEFLDRVRSTLTRSNVSDFVLVPTALEWHRTHESSRSFLVLRVESSSPPAHDTTSNGPPAEQLGTKNAELSALLKCCNGLCRDFGQPELYAFKGTELETGTGKEVASRVGDAFHVSVAWSFAEPTEELRRVTREVFEMSKYSDGLGKMQIKVDGVKAKIGNTVTHLPLSGTGRYSSARGKKGLFGYEP